MEDSILQRYINIPTDSVQVFERNESLLSPILSRFKKITLPEMECVELMQRFDTKFVVKQDLIETIFEKACEYYRVLEIEKKRILPYSTVYFDTPDAKMYSLHHNGKLRRFKIRTRSYMTSGISFIEIKDKSNKGVTQKIRIPVTTEQFNKMSFDEEMQCFVNGYTTYNANSLIPHLQNYFQRITLVDALDTERVTIDLGVLFRNVLDKSVAVFDGLVIIEMKQVNTSKSPFREYLNELKILPGSMSKYCLGMASVNHSLKRNRFKVKIREINKITSNYGKSY